MIFVTLILLLRVGCCLCGLYVVPLCLSLFGCCCSVLWLAMLLWVRLRRGSIGLILG